MGYRSSWLLLSVSLLLLLIIAIVINHLGDGKIRMYYPTPRFAETDIPSLKGKVMVITGANVGLGKAAAQQMARKGAKVVLACRSSCEPLAADLKKEGRDALAMSLDLSDSKSIFKFAQEYRNSGLPIHVLMLNAGVMLVPEFRPTKDNLEMQIGTNHIGHFYLQHLLQDIVEKSAPSRIVILSSAGHEAVFSTLPEGLTIQNTPENRAQYNPIWNYGASKLLNILHVKELADRMRKEKKDVVVVAVHPGAVDTDLGRHIIEVLGNYLQPDTINTIRNAIGSTALTPDEGALTQVWAAVSPEVVEKNLSGVYAAPIARVVRPSALAENEELRRRVWKESEDIIAKFPRKD